jgi:hypothetical protein
MSSKKMEIRNPDPDDILIRNMNWFYAEIVNQPIFITQLLNELEPQKDKNELKRQKEQNWRKKTALDIVRANYSYHGNKIEKSIPKWIRDEALFKFLLGIKFGFEFLDIAAKPISKYLMIFLHEEIVEKGRRDAFYKNFLLEIMEKGDRADLIRMVYILNDLLIDRGNDPPCNAMRSFALSRLVSILMDSGYEECRKSADDALFLWLSDWDAGGSQLEIILADEQFCESNPDVLIYLAQSRGIKRGTLERLIAEYSDSDIFTEVIFWIMNRPERDMQLSI